VAAQLTKTARRQLEKNLHAQLDEIMRSAVRLAKLRGTIAGDIGRVILLGRIEAIKHELAKLPAPRRDQLRSEKTFNGY
jgi:hypothetical protein